MEQNGELVVNFTVNNSGTVTVKSNNPDLVPSSSLTLQGSGANRSVKIRPLANANGAAEITVTVTVTDGVTAPVIQKFIVTVNFVNHAPEANAAEFSGFLNTNLPAVLPAGRDIDGGGLSYILKTNASHGSVSLQSSGNFVYAPTSGYTGDDQFTYVVNDGSLDSSSATVKLHISAPTPPPATAVSLGEVTGLQLAVTSATFNFSIANLAAGQSVAVEYRNTGAATWLAASVSGSAGSRSVTISGLTADLNYEYRIRALEGSVVKAEKVGNFRTLALNTPPLSVPADAVRTASNSAFYYQRSGAILKLYQVNGSQVTERQLYSVGSSPVSNFKADVSPDGSIVVFGMTLSGINYLQIKNLSSGKNSTSLISGFLSSVNWSSSSDVVVTISTGALIHLNPAIVQ
ncbi:MAG: fibronectin type III domain-containing protein [Candidatus Omnitrophica bacterium]|nr:fibronectin type III domain-containing protein [Candidatus Omnitrophota bacterium]